MVANITHYEFKIRICAAIQKRSLVENKTVNDSYTESLSQEVRNQDRADVTRSTRDQNGFIHMMWIVDINIMGTSKNWILINFIEKPFFNQFMSVFAMKF
jgi:hypothetical protein